MAWKMPATPKTARAFKRAMVHDTRRPPPVGVLLSGIDGPVQMNTEPLVQKHARSNPPKEGENE